MKIKTNKAFKDLLNHPEQLAEFFKIAIGEKSSKNEHTEKLEEKGLIINGEVSDGSIVVKRKQKEVIDEMLVNINASELQDPEKSYFIMAHEFQKMFCQNLVNIKARTKNVEEAGWKWVDAVRLMITVDDISIDDLREVYKFLKGHKFWSSNVQSTMKLRDKFQTIHTQMKNDANSKTKQTSTVSDEYKTRVASELQS